MVNNLLSETLSESQRRIMDDLFIKLSSVENDQETEQMLMEYTDYRNYLDYDIKIKYASGDYAYFSKVNKEKSGGETQTPFYVIMAASFEQVIRNRNQNEDFGCVVIFDEAFNNMDEQRIQEMIKFYNEREIQTFIAVPPSRASTIIPYVNTRLLVIKQGQQSFVDRYENSSYYKGKSDGPRKISIVLHKRFPEYGQSFFYEITEELENISFQLKEEGIVTFSKKSIPGNREIILNQEESSIKKIYQELKRVSIKEKIMNYLHQLDEYHVEGFVKDFIDEMKKKIMHDQSLSPYLKGYDLEDLDSVIKILNGMYYQDEEISFRKFSEKILNDTKKLIKYKKRILHIVHDFYDDSLENEDEVFEVFYIRKNPAYVYIRGNAIFKINNQLIDLKQMKQYFVLPSLCIKDLTIQNIDAKQVMTIENLTSFHDLSLNDNFYIYTNGFHNHAIQQFLIKLYDFLGDEVNYLHFGDIDAGGFHIYNDLCKKTHIPFQTYHMDVDTLKKYYIYTKKLTKNDRKRLKSMKNNEVITYMLKNNVKLEQEIIGDSFNER